MIKNQLSFVTYGAAKFRGIVDHYVRFTMDHQLMDAKTWKSFVKVFAADSDDADSGWRCEYWGKMMRGACLTYMYNKDEALYTVLEDTVRDLLTTQRPDGRFSTYSQQAQLQGWDVWGRKYILTSLLHFYHICHNEQLKHEILKALCGHADALIEKVGDGDGQIPITLTSNSWEGVNSCSILDPMLELYQQTGNSAYLAFAEHIIGTGGCVTGTLIELAEENKVMPYEYPEVKAYETISFFEGLLTYYEVTGKERYLDVVKKFVEAVNDTDITIIGCSGCTHELFDHSKVKQVEFSEGIMQETCVTVTWMRILAKLHLLTGEEKYFARMEQSAFNALYGSVNDNNLKQYSIHDKEYVDPLPFDSYSPLYNNKRGRGIGGFKRFSFGGYYGCCACIASAGIAIFPLCALLKTEQGVVINGLLPGTLQEKTPSGQDVVFSIESKYPSELALSAQVRIASPENFTVKVRIPAFAHQVNIQINGETICSAADEGYCTIEREWKNGDSITLNAIYTLEQTVIGGRTAFIYGPLVLARDTAKEDTQIDLTEEIRLQNEHGGYKYQVNSPCEKYNEMVRISLTRADGKAPLLLTDYASCGKDWLRQHSNITVWMNILP